MMNIKEELSLKGFMPDSKQTKRLSNFFYGFSDDTRLRIIILLSISPLCVNEISNVLSVNQTTISHQLKILKSLNIITCDRNGKNIVYYIKNKNIHFMLDATVECI